MPRPPRIAYPGAVYHVTARGVDRQPIYRTDADRRLFLELVARVVRRYGVTIPAYCLMTNHYHLVVATPRANVSRALQQVNGSYGQWFNRLHERTGHLFEGRFRSRLVCDDADVVATCRYVALNPVRAGLCARPRDWPWSSYAATLGEAPVPPFLAASWLLAHFAADRAVARECFRGFVLDGISPHPRAPANERDTIALAGA